MYSTLPSSLMSISNKYYRKLGHLSIEMRIDSVHLNGEGRSNDYFAALFIANIFFYLRDIP